mgnify:CR=1 FL=1
MYLLTQYVWVGFVLFGFDICFYAQDEPADIEGDEAIDGLDDINLQNQAGPFYLKDFFLQINILICATNETNKPLGTKNEFEYYFLAIFGYVFEENRVFLE